ncbi:septum formation protein [Arthrobacter stackebrandtii]|uniref:Nucleoside triphosphate pyrophosphatase n=1 Tax=Arthrobacter stackebrandtii TaxID=272161 RepID=A0ABS4YRQ0_9MICC|nr:nucleoside triphosphate pyrophosphatase [Arthrobacter stackebrandtii]MBP2411481.1 septum formation protein [Arthrobacter stackebrandtii]PYH00246.1 septum formation inhibitor Maf [Arthrobacter stackebrandtii]
MTLPLILASASPARTKLLTDAGIAHTVMVSDADEDALTAAAGPVTPAETALLLARAKAESVAATTPGALVIGCDSVFELDGTPYGKPWEPAVARERWQLMRGRSGVLHTGHWLIATEAAGTHDGGAGVGHGEVTSAVVTFEDVSDAEIDAYVATGEPLQVAGAFTIDGLAGAFITGVQGDPHTVVGLSISTLRRLMAEHGAAVTDYWD